MVLVLTATALSGIADLKLDLLILRSRPSLLRFFGSQICNEISEQINRFFVPFD